MKVLITLLFIFSMAYFGPYVQAQDSHGSNPRGSALAGLQNLQQENPEAYKKKFLELEKNFLQSKDQTQLMELYRMHVDYLNELNSYDSLISVLHRVRGVLNSKPKEESLQIYLALGSNFYFKGNYDSMVYWQSKAEEIVEPTSPVYGEYLLLCGLRKYMEQLYEESISFELKAVEIFEAEKNYKNLANAYNNLASNYLSLGNVDTQQDYLVKAITINKRLGDSYGLVMNYNNLGIFYRNKNRLTEALAVYDSAFAQLESLNFPMLLAQNLTNRGNILEKLGDLKEAETLFLECEQICKANGIPYGVMLSQANLGNLYRQMKRFEQAKVRLEKALALSIEQSAIREKALVFERLAWLARDTRDFEKAYQFITEFHSLNDSLLSESVKKNADELKEKYESEKKELAIISLSKDKLNHQFLIALMGLGIFALVIAIQWTRNKHRTSELERKQEEERLKFLLELKEKELLADSLKRVSVMNTKEAIYNDLKELIKELPRTQSIKFASILDELKGDQNQSILEEFETRYLGVYESFFTKLKEIAPDLTPTELRIAALIRLNFNSKEISIITNRSVRTIDNLRSIIRKKLHMKEEDNLLDKLFGI